MPHPLDTAREQAAAAWKAAAASLNAAHAFPDLDPDVYAAVEQAASAAWVSLVTLCDYTDHPRPVA